MRNKYPLISFILIFNFLSTNLFGQSVDTFPPYESSKYLGSISLNDYVPKVTIVDSVEKVYDISIIDMQSIKLNHHLGRFDSSSIGTYILKDKSNEVNIMGYGAITSTNNSIWFFENKGELHVLKITNGLIEEQSFILNGKTCKKESGVPPQEPDDQ